MGLSQALLYGLAALVVVGAKPFQQGREDLVMPNVQPTVKDTYLCMARQTEDVAKYITEFVPHANMTTAHHVLLYGCMEPGETREVWSCSEMMTTDKDYQQGPVCKEGSQILYAWAMNAPKLTLPKGVAFKVGGDTGVKWLVLQVHYKDVTNFLPPHNQKDTSGITLVTTSEPQPKRAGVYLLGTDGELPPHSTIYMETACGLDEPFDVHPFAYRAHAHGAGRVVSGYRVRDGQWTEIGRVSPQIEQMFYNVTHPDMVVKPGDIVAARCTMENQENRTIFIGPTTNDEMCNFYMMYWVDGNEMISDKDCFSEGPPRWYWSQAQIMHSENVPGDASVVPGTEKVIQATQKVFKSAKQTMEDVNKEMSSDTDELLSQMQDTMQYDPSVDVPDNMEMDDLLRLLALQQYYGPEEDDEYYNNRIY